PTSVLVTGLDIIFFWVSRMITAGLEFKPGKSERDQDNIPFHDVFFTWIIRDKPGRKMSKWLANSPDPLDLVAKYGAACVRFGWGDFCDWFVEAGKTDIFGEDKARKQSTLAAMDYILSAIIRLLHPFMPHLTEELWSLMGFAKEETEFLDFAPLPQVMDLDKASQAI